MQFPKGEDWDSWKKAKNALGTIAKKNKTALEVISKKSKYLTYWPLALYVLCYLFTGWHSQLGPLLMEKINHLFWGIRLVFVHRLMTGVCEDILLSNIRLKNSSWYYSKFGGWRYFFFIPWSLSILKIGCDIIATKQHFSVTPPVPPPPPAMT